VQPEQSELPWKRGG